MFNRYLQLSLRLWLSLIAGLGLAWLTIQMVRAQGLPVAPARPESEFEGLSLPALDTTTRPQTELISSDLQGVTLELVTPEFRVEEISTGESACQVIHVEGFGETDIPGQPRLPVRGAMVAVPPDADIKLTLLDSEPVVAQRKYNLCPVSAPIMNDVPFGTIDDLGYKTQRDEQSYSRDAFSPSQVAELVSTGFLRSQRIVQVRFQPFQYNPVSGELVYHRGIRVRLSFHLGKKFTSSSREMIDEGAYESLLQHNLINYASAQSWRSKPSIELYTPQGTAQPALPYLTQPSYKITLNQDGIYQLTYTDLLTAGLPVASINPRTFQLFNKGQEVAIHVAGQEDESFDEGDKILFYGQKLNTRDTSTNVYWLIWGNTDGLRMSDEDGTPAGGTVPTSFKTTQHFEHDVRYFAAWGSGEDKDVWYWSYTYSYGSRYTATLTLPLGYPDPTVPTATLRGFFRSYAGKPEHHTLIYLNGHLIHDTTWPENTDYFFTTDVPASYLVEKDNVIKVVSPADNGITTDIILINWFELDYAETYTASDDKLLFDGDDAGAWQYQINGFMTDTLDVLDISDPARPVRIITYTAQLDGGAYRLDFSHSITNEHHYLAESVAHRLKPLAISLDTPSDLQSTANAADYIVITHPDFYTSVLPLAAWRSSQDLRTQVVKVDDIYDEFAYGIYDPEAIRLFLAYAYANWSPPAPTYVLLVGDGNYDPKNNLGYGEKNYIPPYLDYIDPWAGETATDNRYVSIVGDDILPDMYVGRLAVRSAVEASDYVSKILAYEQAESADWNARSAFVADNADAAGDFAAFSNAIADYFLPAGYTSQKIYYGVTNLDLKNTQTEIFNAINQGALLVNYIGHASYYYWGMEQLWSRTSIPALTNTLKYPFMVSMSCLDGTFQRIGAPGNDNSSLAEMVTRAPGKGAIGSFSATGMGVASGHDYLNRGLYQSIFYDGITHLGAATTQAKLYLYANTASHHDLIETYLLFGDPATPLKVLPADVQIQQTIEPSIPLHAGNTVTITLHYSNTGQALATHVTIRYDLPVSLGNPVTISSGKATMGYSGEQLAWDVADLAPGENSKIIFRATVNPGFTGWFSTQADIDTAIYEPDKNDNVSTSAILIADFLRYFPLVGR